MARSLSNPDLERWKQSGGRVIGYTCAYVPEELVHAGGFLPYKLSPIGCDSTPDADAHMAHVNCTYARSCLQFALAGEFDLLDGVVFMNSCDHIRRLYDNWRTATSIPFSHFLSVPHRLGDNPCKWYTDELLELKNALEKEFSVQIDDEDIRRSSELLQDSRGYLRKLYETRKSANPPISGVEMLETVLAGFRLPADVYNRLLQQAVTQLGRLEAKEGLRILLAGGVCDNLEFVELIENSGGLVVADTLCFGSRHIWRKEDRICESIEDLAHCSLGKPSCARMLDDESERGQFLADMIRDYSVEGVIYQRIKWCDIWGGEPLFMEQLFEELNIPFLILEREYWLSGAEQMRTRIQAFIELLHGRRVK
jgi:benzoyl-CoA reductase/2-hydroxyglutaryl-CoA dehydratase subunit BcrC/BadD/HgdB